MLQIDGLILPEEPSMKWTLQKNQLYLCLHEVDIQDAGKRH
jgi:hypothetical protein